MILIADASALIALASCNSLTLLEALYKEVLVPDAVFLEVTVAGKPQSDRLRAYLQGKVRSVDLSRFVYLGVSADLGETEAMLLYKNVAADCLLIDDQRGRKIASLNQIKTIGSLGLLLQAKRAGLIARVTPPLEQIAAGPIFMSERLISTVKELAGEDAGPG